MDIQTAGELTKWVVNGLTIVLMVVAAWMAINRKNIIALGVIVLGNLVVYYLTQSPLLCWVVSVAGIIWVRSAGGSGRK